MKKIFNKHYRILPLSREDAIVTAGAIPRPRDPLYPFTQGKPKALLDIAGKPMIQWVLDAISEAKEVGKAVVVGLDGSIELSCDKPLSLLPNHGSMIGNIRAGVRSILEKDSDDPRISSRPGNPTNLLKLRRVELLKQEN